MHRSGFGLNDRRTAGLVSVPKSTNERLTLAQRKTGVAARDAAEVVADDDAKSSAVVLACGRWCLITGFFAPGMLLPFLRH